jgi:hypothetical protein
MNQGEVDDRRQIFIQGFRDALIQALEANRDIVPNGPITTGFGEIKLHNYVCSYTDNPFVNVLDIWFGRLGGRGGHPGELRLEADIDNNAWATLDAKREEFTNQSLAEFCISRLREVAEKG